MKIDQVKNCNHLRPLKLPAYEIPHLTIETNLTCNIACRSCYNLHKNYIKPVSVIKKEIDLALQKRNLETITLLGGEPTLHPQLVDIIRYVKSKKLICQLLTNGIIFLKDKNDILLDKLVRAGLNRILLHIDNGQSHIHSDIEKTRDFLFSKFERKRIFFSLSMTIYKDDQGSIPAVIKRYNHYAYFDGILALLNRDARWLDADHTRFNSQPELETEYYFIQHKLQIEPTTYIPASLDDKYISWLMYFYYINTQTDRTFAVSPEVNRLFRKLYRWMTGHHLFGITVRQKFFIVNFLMTCFVELCMHPLRFADLYRLVKYSSGLRGLRFHYLCLQSGPIFNSDYKQVQLCYHCPDATIRNGKLTPVCVADLINPLPGGFQSDQIPQSLYHAVYQHLGEI